MEAPGRKDLGGMWTSATHMTKSPVGCGEGQIGQVLEVLHQGLEQGAEKEKEIASYWHFPHISTGSKYTVYFIKDIHYREKMVL